MAAPMPREPPVTNTTLPLIRGPRSEMSGRSATDASRSAGEPAPAAGPELCVDDPDSLTARNRTGKQPLGGAVIQAAATPGSGYSRGRLLQGAATPGSGY